MPSHATTDLAAAGINAYPHDGRPGAWIAELDGYTLEFDRDGIYDIMRSGDTEGAATTLHFLDTDARDAALAAASTVAAAGTGIDGQIRAAVAVCTDTETAS